VSQLVMMSSFTFLTTSTLRLHLSCCCQAPARPPPLRFVRQCVAGRQVGGRQAGRQRPRQAGSWCVSDEQREVQQQHKVAVSLRRVAPSFMPASRTYDCRSSMLRQGQIGRRTIRNSTA
jgi:hypothetical protein